MPNLSKFCKLKTPAPFVAQILYSLNLDLRRKPPYGFDWALFLIFATKGAGELEGLSLNFSGLITRDKENSHSLTKV